MTNFMPDLLEELITVEITEKELLVLEELRKYDFGKIIIHKSNGILVRMEPMISIKIS